MPAAITSAPMPSPGIAAMRWVRTAILSLSTRRPHAGCNRRMYRSVRPKSLQRRGCDPVGDGVQRSIAVGIVLVRGIDRELGVGGRAGTGDGAAAIELGIAAEHGC